MSGPLPSNSERMRPIQFVSSSFFLSKTATTINFYKMQQPRNGQARITTNEQPVRKQKSKTNKQKSEFYKQQLKKKKSVRERVCASNTNHSVQGSGREKDGVFTNVDSCLCHLDVTLHVSPFTRIRCRRRGDGRGSTRWTQCRCTCRRNRTRQAA